MSPRAVPAGELEDRPEIAVLLHRDQLDPARLGDQIVVVLDIIFATTTLVTALGAGARAAIPAPDEAGARRLAASLDPATCVLAGEHNARVLDGFAHYAPQRLSTHGLDGRTLVYATTNGTPSLLEAARAAHAYAGALRNRRATCRHLAARHAGDDIVLLCAGAAGRFNLEDFFGAGAYVASLDALAPGTWRLSDSAQAARATFRGSEAAAALHGSRVGRLMHDLGLAGEIDYSAQLDVDPWVARLHQGRLRRIDVGG